MSHWLSKFSGSKSFCLLAHSRMWIPTYPIIDISKSCAFSSRRIG